jgi:Tfp pilus assembly protein PilZ
MLQRRNCVFTWQIAQSYKNPEFSNENEGQNMSLNDRSYEEKRDYIRMRVEADVNLLYAGQIIPAVCIDLSSSGMQVQAPRTFKVGDKLSVQIDSEHAALKGLEADTEVVWVTDEEGGGQKLGLTIIKMN